MHQHHCPKCRKPFDCDADFCKGITSMDCDSCWEADAKVVPHPDGGYQQLVDYVRERETV